MYNNIHEFPFRSINDVLNDNNIKVTVNNLFIIIGDPKYPLPNDIINRLEQSYLGYYLVKQLVAKHTKIILNYTKDEKKIDEAHTSYGVTYHNNKKIELFMLSNQYTCTSKKNYNGIDQAMCAICHEATHLLLGIGGCQWAEAVCKASEIISLTNDCLTKNEKKRIVKWARDNYKQLKWKTKNIPYLYRQYAFDLLSFADIIPLYMSNNYSDRIKAQIYNILIEIYENPYNIENLKMIIKDKNTVIKILSNKNNKYLYKIIASLNITLKEIYKIDMMKSIENNKIKTIEILKIISDSCKNKYITKWDIVK